MLLQAHKCLGKVDYDTIFEILTHSEGLWPLKLCMLSSLHCTINSAGFLDQSSSSFAGFLRPGSSNLAAFHSELIKTLIFFLG